MKFSLPILVLVLAVATTSQAFPIQTADSAIKIVGMINLEDGFALDVENSNIKDTGIIAAGYTQNPLLKSIQIVDSDDRFISNDNQFDIAVDRVLYCFRLDKPATQIQRIRIETNEGNILSLPWEGIPEAASNNVIMRLYGVSDKSISDPTSRIPVKKYYGFEIKITNNMDRDLLLSSGDFRLLDQFDYPYIVNSEEIRLISNESVRYTLGSGWMSPISRPERLVFLPENLTMDLEGWY